MRLFLVRHGQAVTSHIDPLRPLSTEGRSEARHLATHASPLLRDVTTFWHSGKTRAEETARILADVSEVGAKVVEHEGLKPNDDPELFVEELNGRHDKALHCGALTVLVGAGLATALRNAHPCLLGV